MFFLLCILFFIPNLQISENQIISTNVEQTRYPFEPKTPIVAEVKTPKEIDCLSKAIFYESSTQSRKGKEAVAKVILNRKRSDKFPDTICQIVKEKRRENKCQFSTFCKSKKPQIYGKNWEESKKVASLALKGKLKYVSPSFNALYFHSKEVKPNWSRKMILVARIDDHLFYSER